MRDLDIIFITNIPVEYRDGLFNKLIELRKVRYYFFPERNNTRKFLISDNSELKFLSYSKIFTGRFRILHLLFSIVVLNPNYIVVGGLPWYLFFIGIVAKFKRIELVSWWGGTTESEKNRSQFIKLYRKIVSCFISKQLFYSKYAKLQYVEEINSGSKGIILGNNTRDSNRFKSKYLDLEKRVNNKRMVLTTSAYLEHRKNVKIIIESLRGVNFSYILNIVGDGPERLSLEELAIECGVNVRFHGLVTPAMSYRIISKSDIYIHSALLDQWPQSYNEAICLGVPTIVSMQSKVDDFYVNKYAEFVMFDANNNRELSEKLELLVTSPKLYNELKYYILSEVSVRDGVDKAKMLNDFLE